MLLKLIIGLSIATLLFGSIIVLWFIYKSHFKNRRQILKDLGLLKSKSGNAAAPFYKWGWRKQEEERVWAERIVKNAFENAGIWLSLEDLKFFENVCTQHQDGTPIKDEIILKRIDTIIDRSEMLAKWLSGYIKKTIQAILNTSIDKATEKLRESGIKTDPEKVLLRYGNMQLRKQLGQAGADILGLNAKGFRIEDEKKEHTFLLRGFEGWKHWVTLYTQELKKQLTSGFTSSSNQALINSMRGSVIQGLFNDYEEDINESISFRETLMQEVASKNLHIPPEKIRDIEMIFYTWQFDINTPFNLIDHKQARQLLVRRDLTPRFRERIINSIESDILSLQNLIQSFPRRVIFFGKNANARHFASQQYLLHLEMLLRFMGSPANDDTNPPGLIRIIEKDILNALEQHTSLAEAINKQKKFNIFERGIDEREADFRGWIIDMPVEDATLHQFEDLNTGEYKHYTRFQCDSAENIDFESNTFNANKQRIIFLDMVIDTLLSTPPIGVPA